MLKLTKESLGEKIKKIDNEYELLEFTNRESPITILHETCGTIYTTYWYVFQRGSRCPCTNKFNKKSDDEWKRIFQEKYGDERYKLLEIMRNDRIYYKVKCLTCGKIFKRRCDSLSEEICVNCINLQNREKQKEKLISQFNEKTNLDYHELVDVYWTSTKKQIKPMFKIYCNKCDSVFEISAYGFFRNPRCKCFGRKPYGYWEKKFEEFNKSICYVYHGWYMGNKGKGDRQIVFYNITCKKCGKTFSIDHEHYFRGQGCICNMTKKPRDHISIQNGATNTFSKGEHKIFTYLKSKGKNFLYQYSFSDCRDILPLPFDFAVLNEDGSLNCLIEYDGEQHYIKDSIYYSEKTVLHDSIKTKYCKDNNIKLIRIPYWDFDEIDNILQTNRI